MTFLHPQLLWLLLLLPALLIIYIVWRRRQQASLRVPSLLFISGVRGGLRVYLRRALCPASPCLGLDHRSLGTPSELLFME